MAPAAGGRHCARCDRFVRDLSGTSDDALAEMLRRNPELYLDPSIDPFHPRVPAGATGVPLEEG